MTANSANPLVVARRNDSERCRDRVLDVLERFRADGQEITVSAVARGAGGDRSFLYRHNDLRSRILAAADQPEPPSSSSTLTSRRSVQADLANLRAHNERLRHQNAGLTPTNEIANLRKRVAELEQQRLDYKQDISRNATMSSPPHAPPAGT